MRFIITLITSLILLIPASGQGRWEIVSAVMRTTYRPDRGELEYAIHDVQFLDRDNGFLLCGAYALHLNVGLLYKTVDGGRSWVRIIEDSQGYQSFHFVNDSNGFMIIGSGLFASSDGGLNWTENNSMDVRVGTFYFLNDSTFWVAQRSNIYKTINGGIGWNREYFNSYATDFYSLYFIDDSTGWGVGEVGLISKYSLSDGWKDIPDVTDLPLRKVFFIDRNNGWASGGYDSWGESSNIYLRTVDGGETWSEISGLNYMINDFYFVNKDHGWAVGEYNVEQYDYDNGQYYYVDRGVILETFNGGVDWEVVIDELPARLNALHIADGVGWVVGDDGLILKCDSVATGIKDNSLVGSNEPSFKNYPNPFHSSTIISYQLPATSNVELCVYDISGRKVTTLVYETQLPDKYEVEWDAEGMSSGIYFCELKTGQGRQVMKMTLID